MFVPLTPLDFERRAATLYRDKVGIVDGEQRFTYGQFDERVHRLANALHDLGISPGARVAFLSYNCHQLLEAYFGVVEAGMTLLPLNIRLSPSELCVILDHAEAELLFFDPDFLPIVRTMRPALPSGTRFVVLSGDPPEESAGVTYESLLTAAPAQPLPLEVDENAICELFYTSGSTGQPKGVSMTHRTLYLHAMNAIIDGHWCDEDIVLHVVPLFHVNGWGTPQALTAVGGRHVMLRKFSPAEVCRQIECERVTRLFGVPTMLNAILLCPEVRTRDLSSLKEVLLGGAPSSEPLLREIERVIGCRALTGYGLTETTPILTTARPLEHIAQHETDAERIRRQATTGRPLLGVDLRVVTADMRDVPADGQAVGEIVARSNVVMHGYYREPEATAEAMRGGWFHTGDMAVIDSHGYVTIVDRLKDIIISGGENISSIEVEKTLAEHPAVFETAVIAIPDEQWGEVPLAFIVARPGVTVTPDELDAHCRQHLAGYKRPKQYVLSEELPKGGTGKILKNQLREPFWQGRERRVN